MRSAHELTSFGGVCPFANFTSEATERIIKRGDAHLMFTRLPPIYEPGHSCVDGLPMGQDRGLIPGKDTAVTPNKLAQAVTYMYEFVTVNTTINKINNTGVCFT
jgi:hypothetical protein